MCVDLTVTSARVHAYMRLVVGSNGMECTEKENFAIFFLIMTHMAPANFVGAGKPLCNLFMVYCVLKHVISPGAITKLNLYISFHLDCSYLVSNFYSRYQ